MMNHRDRKCVRNLKRRLFGTTDEEVIRGYAIRERREMCEAMRARSKSLEEISSE